MPAQTPSLLSTESMKGGHVKGTQGEDLGTIKEVMIDLSAGRVAYAVLSFGGFLGIGARIVALPWDALRASTRADEYVTDISKDRLKEAPSFDRSKWSHGADRSFLNDLYAYYGYTPYWAGEEAGAERMDFADEPAKRGPAVVETIETVTETTTTEYTNIAEAGAMGSAPRPTGASDLEPRSQRTASLSSGGGMRDNDMDTSGPGENIRSSESPESRTPDSSTEHAYGAPAEGSSTGAPRDAGPDYWYREGGSGGTAEKASDAATDEGARNYSGADFTSHEEGDRPSHTPYGGGNPGAAEGFEETSLKSDEAFNTTSGGTDRYSDTSGANARLEPEDRSFGDIPEGQGDTRAFEVDEEISAVSGFGSTHDIVNMSGASGPSAADMTGGSEGMSAAEDLTIGSVDDLNTTGSTLGLDDDLIENEDEEDDLELLPGEGNRRGSSSSGDLRRNEEDDADTQSGPRRSGRGRSGGQPSSSFGTEPDEEEKDSQ